MSDQLRLQTLALIGQEFLLNALANGGSLDSSMADMLLRPQQPAGKKIMAEALTGRIRSDAGMLRQGSKNAAEVASMATLIKNATLTLGESLSKMQTVVQSYKAGSLSLAEAQDAFTNLAQSISGTISGASYNGISLLNKSGWAGDERVTTAPAGDTGTLVIQMGSAQSTFTLRDLSSLDYSAVDLGTADLDALNASISTAIGTVTTMSSGYEALAGSYTGEAKYFQKQADLLIATADRTINGPPKEDGEGQSPQSILMDLMLRNQGRLVDTSS